MKKLIQKYRRWRIVRAHRVLRAHGFVILDRGQWVLARANAWNIHDKIKTAQGGNISKKTLKAQKNRLQTLSSRFARYLAELDNDQFKGGTNDA